MSTNSVLDPVVQQTLPVSTGSTTGKREMNDTNTQLTELVAASRADTLYDPNPPPPASPGGTVAGFCNFSYPTLFAAGILLVIFAFIKTK